MDKKGKLSDDFITYTVAVYILYSHPSANDTLKLRNWLHQIWAQPFTTKTT